MSGNADDALIAPVGLEQFHLPENQLSPLDFRSWISLLAPIVTTLVVLGIHWFVPDEQPPPLSWLDSLPRWHHPFPLLLGALLLGSLVWLLIQGVWPKLRPWWLYHAPLVAGGVILLGIADLITVKWGLLPYPYFPGPNQILGSLIEDRSLLLQSTGHSLRLLLTGYAAGVVAGLLTGIPMGWFPGIRYWIQPLMKVIGPIPATALVPLVMTLFPASLSFFSAASLIAFAVWFPMAMLTSSGIANVRLSYLDVARTLGASRVYLIFYVALPSALPNIFLGLFMGLSASFLTLIVAETVGVRAGLGWYLQWQKGYAEYGKVYAALVVMALLFSTIMTLLFLLRDRILRWQKGVIRW